jgi:Rap guanine nucleotide exchange factor 1
VYQSLARLIKLCDEVLLQGEKALDNENDVSEVIQLLEGAVQVWVVAVDRVLRM